MSARFTLAAMVQLAAALAFAGFFIGLFGRHFWLFDLFAHFRMQYAVVLLICGLICLLLGYRKTGTLNLVVFSLLGLTFWPFALADGSQNTPALKVISYNVYTGNNRSQEVRDFLRSESADVVFLMEIDSRWMRELQPLFDLYPYRLESPREDNFGIMLLSKIPFNKGEILYFGEHDLPAADITVSKDTHAYRILGIHVLPPVRTEATTDRNYHLMTAAQMLSHASTPHRLLIGDFNLTPYSPWFGEILRVGQLQNLSPGYAPTWRTGNPLFSIPIDHILTSRTLTVRSRRVGPSLGSDHNALIADVAPAPK